MAGLFSWWGRDRDQKSSSEEVLIEYSGNDYIAIGEGVVAGARAPSDLRANYILLDT